jgi:hypothetical protein
MNTMLLTAIGENDHPRIGNNQETAELKYYVEALAAGQR